MPVFLLIHSSACSSPIVATLEAVLIAFYCNQSSSSCMKFRDWRYPRKLGAALETFAAALDERWSYRHANHADFHAAIDVLRKRSDRGCPPASREAVFGLR